MVNRVDSVPQIPFIFQTQKTSNNKVAKTDLQMSYNLNHDYKYDCFVSQRDGKVKTLLVGVDRNKI